MLHRCYRDVTIVLQGVTFMLQGCYMDVKVVLQESYRIVTVCLREDRRCYRCFTGVQQGVTGI